MTGDRDFGAERAYLYHNRSQYQDPHHLRLDSGEIIEFHFTTNTYFNGDPTASEYYDITLSESPSTNASGFITSDSGTIVCTEGGFGEVEWKDIKLKVDGEGEEDGSEFVGKVVRVGPTADSVQ
ncbi:hypothetical protein [Halomarina pelagica]|uniref:hypothetical protein n=1 Tax=Halomarina pelagica TaxID=2961599 RepID=UPI0020C334BB|nr:hypothetical protein [Halomarina sp. BND7]